MLMDGENSVCKAPRKRGFFCMAGQCQCRAAGGRFAGFGQRTMPQLPITPPSFLVISTVVERGRVLPSLAG